MTDPLIEKSALERQVDGLTQRVEDLQKELDLQHQEIHDVYKALALPMLMLTKVVTNLQTQVASLTGATPTPMDPLEDLFNLPSHDPKDGE